MELLSSSILTSASYSLCCKKKKKPTPKNSLKISVVFFYPHPSLRLIWDWKGLLPWLRPRLQLSSQHRDGIRWTGPEQHTQGHNFTQTEIHPAFVVIVCRFQCKIPFMWTAAYHRCVRGSGDTGSKVSVESHGASGRPGRRALLRGRDSPETSEKLLRKHTEMTD